jgi:hypothetical protein
MKNLEQLIVLLLMVVIKVNTAGAIKHVMAACIHSFIGAASKWHEI